MLYAVFLSGMCVSKLHTCGMGANLAIDSVDRQKRIFVQLTWKITGVMHHENQTVWGEYHKLIHCFGARFVNQPHAGSWKQFSGDRLQERLDQVSFT